MPALSWTKFIEKHGKAHLVGGGIVERPPTGLMKSGDKWPTPAALLKTYLRLIEQSVPEVNWGDFAVTTESAGKHRIVLVLMSDAGAAERFIKTTHAGRGEVFGEGWRSQHGFALHADHYMGFINAIAKMKALQEKAK